jgi:tetratricopeptide (TPR) repeat protein
VFAALLAGASIASAEPSDPEPPATAVPEAPIAEPPPVVAPADANAQAGELLEQAKQHFARGEYGAAVPLLERAYALTRSPRYLLNLGIAHHYLNECEAALGYYQRYLQSDPQGQWRAQAMTAVDQLSPICAPAAASPAPAASLAKAAPLDQPPAAADAQPRSGERVAAWVLLGAGAASLAASIVFTAEALGARSDRQDLQRSVPPGQPWDDFAGRQRDTELDQEFRRDQTVAWVLAGSSVVLFGTGAVLLQRASTSDVGHASAPQPASSLALGWPGVRYAGSF